MTPMFRCEWCKRPLDLGREPWTKRVLPTTPRREGVVCESCAEGLDEMTDLERIVSAAIDNDVDAALSVDRAVRTRERAAAREASPYEPPKGTF